MNSSRRIISIDIGYRHFGIVCMDVDLVSHDYTIQRLGIKDFITSNHTTTTSKQVIVYRGLYEWPFSILRQLYEYLDSFSYLWKMCGPNIQKPIHVLIERQMEGKHRCNIKALRLSQHVLAYFLLTSLDHVRVSEYSSKWKTQSFGVQFSKKSDRKKWTVEQTRQFLENLQDPVSLDFWNMIKYEKKQDDVADCIMMIRSFVDRNFF